MFLPQMQRAPKKTISTFLSICLAFSWVPLTVTPASSVHAAEPGTNLGLLDVAVNKPLNAVVDLNHGTIAIAMPYGAVYQMLNITTNPGASASLYRSDGTTAISFAASGINKGDAKLDQFAAGGPTTYYLKVSDNSNSSNSRTYTITVTVNNQLPSTVSNVGPNDKYLPLNIRSGEDAWDVLGASKIGNGAGTGSIEGPGAASSYSGKDWTNSYYDRSGDYPVAATVPDSWLGDNMYLQTIGKNDSAELQKYGINNIPGNDKLNSDILRYHEFVPFVDQNGVSRDDGDRGAVGSDRQRLEIKTNTASTNADANSVGGEIMTHHWRLMLPSEMLRYQKDVGDKHAGDFIVPHRFFHIFQLKDAAGNANGQPLTTLSLVSKDGIGQLEFRNNPDGNYADRIKSLFSIPFDKIVDRWLDMEVTILTADSGYIYGKLTDLSTGQVLFQGGMTAETLRRPEAVNPATGRTEETDLPVEPGQENRSKWGLYHGLYNGAGDAAYADEFQASTMYLSDVYLIKRDQNSYVFPDGWDPKAQPKDVEAWARPDGINASKGTAFSSLPLPSQLDVTLSTGNTQKVDVTWSPDGYDPSKDGIYRIYGQFSTPGITNSKNIKPYIDVNLSEYRNWAQNAPDIKVVSQVGTGPDRNFIDGDSSTSWQAHSSLGQPNGGAFQYWAAVKLEQKISIDHIQIEWNSNSKFLKNYQLYYTNDDAAYNELIEGGTLSSSSNATQQPLKTAHGSSWIPIPGAGKSTALANNEAADLKLSDPVDAQYVLLVSDVNQTAGAGGIKSNEFRIYGEPSGSRVRLNDLKVDGNSVPGFKPTQTSYNYTLSAASVTLPKVEASAPDGMGVKIEYPDDYRSAPVTVTVYDPSGNLNETAYQIHLISPYAKDPIVLSGNTPNYAYSDSRFSNSTASGLVTDIPGITTYRQFSPAPNVGDWFSLTMNGVSAGSYHVEVGYKDGTNRGVGQLSVDGMPLGDPIVEYRDSTSGVFQKADVGDITFVSDGSHTFKFTVVGNGGASATNTAFTVAYVRLVPIVPDFILVNSLSLDNNNMTLPFGQSKLLQATVLPEEATNKVVTWSSSDTSVATVDQNGLVTGKKEGTATITATIGRLTAASTVTVTPAIVSIMPENVTTKAGTAPVLPSVVTAVYSNNTTKQVSVVWDAVAPSQYTAAGSFTVQGTVSGTNVKALANITVTKADAGIAYTGPLTAAGPNINLSALVREQNGGPGKLGGLPVTFDVKKVDVSGAVVPYRTASVTTNVYGGADLAASLPAGLYQVTVSLSTNPYYNEASAKPVLLAVNTSNNGTLQVNGFIDVPVPAGIFGAKANKIHIESEWQNENGIMKGSTQIHAEPQGLELQLKQTDWVVMAGTNGFVQGRATDGTGSVYTVRLMVDNTQGKNNVLSIVVWKGNAAEGTPAAELYANDFSGSIQIH